MDFHTFGMRTQVTGFHFPVFQTLPFGPHSPNLDVQATKAQDIGDAETLAQIRARKQELRDLPATLAPTLASALSVGALKAIQPLA